MNDNHELTASYLYTPVTLKPFRSGINSKVISRKSQI